MLPWRWGTPTGLDAAKNTGTAIGLCKELLFSPYCLFIVRRRIRWRDRHILKRLRGNAMSFMSPLQWIVILAVVLLLFGGRGKVSAIMGDFGKGLRNFKTGLKGDEADAAAEDDAEVEVIEAAPAAKKATKKKAPAKKAAKKATATKATAKKAASKKASKKSAAKK
jgi:sec-independent protein translocase protein TatA